MGQMTFAVKKLEQASILGGLERPEPTENFAKGMGVREQGMAKSTISNQSWARALGQIWEMVIYPNYLFKQLPNASKWWKMDPMGKNQHEILHKIDTLGACSLLK